MMRSVVLHGALREQFGGPFQLDIASPADALRALLRQLKGFPAAIRKGEYRLIRGSIDHDRAIPLEAIEAGLGASTEVHIVPVVAGSSGLTSILAGLALVAIALAAPYVLPEAIVGLTAFTAVTNAVFAVGASLALSGAAQLLTVSPKTTDSKDSFLFSGQLNVASQGGPVPLVYGQFLVGSVVVSAGLETQQLLSASVGPR